MSTLDRGAAFLSDWLATAADFVQGSTVSLAVTGLSRAGKTVFITSLAHNLLSAMHQPYRMPLLRARNTLDSWASREAAFIVNNWILLFCAFFVLFATMFPTLSEAVTGERLTVSAPFFNKWMLPIGLVLLLLSSLIVGAGWPLVVEQISVRPNAAQKESEYIARSITATRRPGVSWARTTPPPGGSTGAGCSSPGTWVRA